MFEDTDRLLEEYSGKKVAGACAVVFVDGKTAYERYCGFSDPGKGNPLGENTFFRLASMTKPVTAVSALLCMEKGLFSLDDPIERYLPAFSELYLAEKSEGGFVRGKRVDKSVTVKNLLSHGSGIGSGESGEIQFEAVKPREGDTVRTAVDRYAGTYLDFIPGTKQAYSPVMAMDVVVALVEETADMPYGDFLKKYVCDPLGVRFTYSVTGGEDFALCTKDENGTLLPVRFPGGFGDFPDGYTGGGAGLSSTLRDYAVFAEAVRRSFDGRGILKRESAEAMRTPCHGKEIEGVGDLFNWGLGCRTLWAQSDWQTLSPGSFGWSGAYGTHFWIDPAKKLTAVYMHSSASYGGSGAEHAFTFEKSVNASV